MESTRGLPGWAGVNSITDIAGGGLTEHLQAAWLNHQAVANNIANANTPGYAGIHVAYNPKKKLADALPALDVQRSDPAHVPSVEWQPLQRFDVTPVPSVQLDAEMAEMNKNNVFFQTLLEVVQRQDRMSRTVIEGR